MKSILFVCLGNICRSPTAEAVMNHLITTNKLENVLRCESAGTAGYHIGETPDPRTRAHGEKRGYRFESVAQKINPAKDFDRFDLILGMDQSNFQNLKQLDPSGKYAHKIKLFLEFAEGTSEREVPDPYYEGAQSFEQVIDLCEQGCAGLLKWSQK